MGESPPRNNAKEDTPLYRLLNDVTALSTVVSEGPTEKSKLKDILTKACYIGKANLLVSFLVQAHSSFAFHEIRL